MEEGTTGNTDWREQARKDGYEFTTKADMDKMRSDVNAAKDLRASIPEEYRNDPSQFFSDASDAIRANKERDNSEKTEVERLQSEITSLKGNLTKAENRFKEAETKMTGLEKQNHSLNMWGHIGRIQQLRNVVVDDTFIDDAKIDNFDVSRYDISTEHGMKDFQNAVWTEILEPGAKRQESVVSRVAGHRAPAPRENGRQNENQREQEPATPAWGSRV